MIAGMASLGVVGIAVHNGARVATLRRHGPARGGVRRHEALVGEGIGAPQRLLVLGDSAADGFALADPQDAFPFQVAMRVASVLGRPVEVSSVAENGATTAVVLRDQIPELARRGAEVVVLSVGVNDAAARHRPDRVHDDTDAMLRAARAAAPDARIVLLTCPDLSTAPRLPRPLRDLLGWSCRRVARAQVQAAAALGVPAAVVDGHVEARLYGADGFHPGPSGQAAMAELTVAALLPPMTRGRADPAGGRR